jgi:uroporphyrinogen decarboxylase
LNSRDRVLSAIFLEEPDRVPLLEVGISDAVLKKIFPILTERKKFIALSKLGLDSLVVWPFLNHQKSKQINGNKYVDEFGRLFTRKISFSTSDFYLGGTLNTPEKYDAFPRPDPHDPWRIEYFKECVEASKGQLFLIPCCGSVFEVAVEAVGFVDFFRYMQSNLSFIKRVIKDYAEYTIACGNALIDAGAEAILIADDFAYKTGPFISPKSWMEIIYPELRRVVNSFHNRGVPVLLHCDGNINLLMNGIIEAGIDAVQPLEPTAGMKLCEVKAKYGEKICLIGNIDVAYTLVSGTMNQVIREVKNAINDAAYSGGYILGSGHTIHDSVSPQNFIIMLKAAKKYGKYPFSSAETWKSMINLGEI